MTSPCAACTLGCCFQYAVTVTGYDVWVIAKSLRLAPEAFLVTVPQREQNNRGFLLDDSDVKYDIALDKVARDKEGQPCVFWLGFPSGVGRRGIYPQRPFACQVYPAYLDDGETQRREDVLCADDAWRDGILEQPRWRDTLIRMQIEFDIYALAVARWNHHVLNTPRPGLIDNLGYYTYLMSFYRQLEPIRAGLDADEWQLMCEKWAEFHSDGGSPLAAEYAAMRRWSWVIHGIRAVPNGFFPSDRGLAQRSKERERVGTRATESAVMEKVGP